MLTSEIPLTLRKEGSIYARECQNFLRLRKQAFFYALVQAPFTSAKKVPLCSGVSLLILGKESLSCPQRELQFHPHIGGGM